VAEKLKKINIYLRPELKSVAQWAAAKEGLSLSAWFRKQVHQALSHQSACELSQK